MTSAAWMSLLVGVACTVSLCPGCGRQTAWPKEITDRPRELGGLSCDLYLPQERVATSGEVRVYVLLANNGTQPVTVDGRMNTAAHVSLFLAAWDGEVSYWPGYRAKLVRPTRDDFVTLRPASLYGKIVSIPVKEVSQKGPGVYRLIALFEAWEKGEGLGLHAWKGWIRSNEVRLDIAAPK